MATEIDELLQFLTHSNAALRKNAAEAVAGLTATDAGHALLVDTDACSRLRRLIGDLPVVARPALTALVNLSAQADSSALQQILRTGIVSGLMETLRDGDASPEHKRIVIMLLSNLSQTPEGCDQVLQKAEAGGARLGAHFRRLIQWFVAPVPASDVSPSVDTFEYVANVLENASQLPEARRMLLEPERAILPALLPQLRAASAVRRRGIAGTLRNCCFESSADTVAYMLSPAVDVVTALLLPLAGPDVYHADERSGMHPSLYAAGARKVPDSDASCRRRCVEALTLLATTRPAREHMRRVRAYPVVRTFHEWLEAAAARDAAPGSASAAAAVEDADPALSVDDEATVASINVLVQQLFRDDEVKHTSEVTGKFAPSALSATSAAAPLDAFAAAPAPASAVAAMDAPTRKMHQAVPVEKARLIAAGVASGAAHAVTDEDVEALVTRVPDWTEDDPEV